MQTTVSGAAGKFFRDFKSFARDAESTCRDLKTNLERPPLTEQEGGNSAQILVENIALQVDEISQEIDRISSFQGFNKETDHLSLEALYLRCFAAYEKNEQLKEDLETKLEQYSYQRKDSTKQKVQPSKIPLPTSKPQPKPSGIPKPNLASSSSSSLPSSSSSSSSASSSSSLPSSSALSSSSSNPSSASSSSSISSTKSSTTAPLIEEPVRKIEAPTPSPPHTPPRAHTPPPSSSSNLFDDFPRTPTLEDVGISASALELIAQDQVKKPKNKPIPKQPSFTDIPTIAFKPSTAHASILPLEPEEEFKIENIEKIENSEKSEKRSSNASSSSSGSRASVEEMGGGEGNNFISDRRKPKSKKTRGGKASLFPLMEAIQQEEYNGITPEYLKHSFSLEQLNKAVLKINEHMTDKRFSMEDELSEGSLESFTEADLRDDLEFGVKAKGLVLLLIHLKRIALDKRFGGTRLTILEKQH